MRSFLSNGGLQIVPLLKAHEIYKYKAPRCKIAGAFFVRVRK